ncbi:hypothetical protein YC2023_040558 [Brassica napus]
MGNMKDANLIMDEIKKQAEAKHPELSESDLIQFTSYLLETLQRDALPLFNMLRVRYKSCIDREPLLNEVIQRSKHRERDLFILLTETNVPGNFCLSCEVAGRDCTEILRCAA